MPNNPWIWVLAIVVGAVVLVIALRRGGKVKAGVGAASLEFEERKEPDDADVSVLDHGRVEESELGNVIGVAGAAGLAGKARVDVAKGAEISRSKTGDIIGVQLGGGKRGQAGEP